MDASEKWGYRESELKRVVVGGACFSIVIKDIHGRMRWLKLLEFQKIIVIN